MSESDMMCQNCLLTTEAGRHQLKVLEMNCKRGTDLEAIVQLLIDDPLVMLPILKQIHNSHNSGWAHHMDAWQSDALKFFVRLRSLPALPKTLAQNLPVRHL